MVNILGVYGIGIGISFENYLLSSFAWLLLGLGCLDALLVIFFIFLYNCMLTLSDEEEVNSLFPRQSSLWSVFIVMQLLHFMQSYLSILATVSLIGIYQRVLALSYLLSAIPVPFHILQGLH